MAIINVTEFVDSIRGWAANRGSQFKYNWPVKGGWEGWIQVDLTGFILTVNPTVEILREQPVYANTRQRCDLLLNAKSEPHRQIIVEIKAESLNNWENFITGVVDDLDKLDSAVGLAYQKTDRVMLAMPFNPPSYEELMALQMDGHKIFAAVYLGGGDVACAVAIRTATGWLTPGVSEAKEPAKAMG